MWCAGVMRKLKPIGVGSCYESIHITTTTTTITSLYRHMAGGRESFGTTLVQIWYDFGTALVQRLLYPLEDGDEVSWIHGKYSSVPLRLVWGRSSRSGRNLVVD